MLRIYNFARGARGLRIMWQCEEMALPYTVEAVSYPVSEAYRALHSPGTVPFLADDASGVGMGESVAILLYLAQRHGPTPLLPGADDPRLPLVLELAEFGEATLGAALNPLIATRFSAPEAEKRNWTTSFLEARVAAAAGYVERRLADAPFLAGEALTLADISVVPALLMWRGIFAKLLTPPLAAYVERATSRPAYGRARARCDGRAAPRP
ncbi:MAG TPA: glutathione S-transferase family protein [Steroidobacteraceae bacterium]|jgi:glutathione S-transferase|nr:glutathione S-transferase family protein [Steroidobacteraceae bacterium]